MPNQEQGQRPERSIRYGGLEAAIWKNQGEGGDVPQFSTIYAVSTATPTQAQYDAINGALYGDTILDADVVFFSRNGENDRVWGQIGDHIFCREYIWR